MITFTIELKNNKDIKTIQKFSPIGRRWRCNKINGNWSITIADDENTIKFNDYIRMFLELTHSTHTLQRKKHQDNYIDDESISSMPTLF